MNKSMNATYNLLEEMAINNSHWPNERQLPKKNSDLIEVDEATTMKAHIEALTKQVSKTGASARHVNVMGCDLYTSPHLSVEYRKGTILLQGP
ncbi:hypothetical protein Dsin_019445 [Dipteronia sinensis]|uniref:Uncharacterized protein n=1 Tax=Dipteronia sinensis TaxID=43782 RepID=A0AAE0A830_9ROSI|nr:hypothetical protein Dsin_019445 [Dipteronia sinensis]